MKKTAKAVKRVLVNGVEATAKAANFAEWQVELPGLPTKLTAHAEDAAGNMEVLPHAMALPVK